MPVTSDVEGTATERSPPPVAGAAGAPPPSSPPPPSPRSRLSTLNSAISPRGDGRGEDVDRGLADHGDEFVEPPGPDGVDDEGEEERE